MVTMIEAARGMLLCLLALASLAWSAAIPSKILVVYDSTFEKSDYSTFFSSLESKGHQITFRSTKDTSPSLVDYEKKAFDSVFLFAPTSKSLSQDLTPQKLIDFLKDNGNVLITVSPELSEMYRDFAREFDLELEERGTQLIDHFSSLQDDSAHNSVIVPPSGHLQQLSGVFPGVKFRLPFVYKGIAHRIGNNPLAFPILKPTTTSYSFEPPSVNSSLEKLDNPDRNVLLGSDADASLISAFQLLNTDRRNVDQTTPKRTGSAGRAVWCGSMAAFSNEFVDAKRVKGRDGTSYPGTSNLQVLTTMISWLTQQHGVLRVDSTSHERVKQHENDDRESYEEWQIEQNGETKHIQRMYRVQDIVTYHVDISQHTPSGWTPGPTDLDLQVSLVMLDPFITTNLTAASPQSLLKSLNTSSSSSTTMTPAFTRYSSTFKLPDKHGVYTFVVDWKRHGWSYIHTRDTAPVRPFNHDEHPRGLHSAWPYVTGASTTVVAFLIFVVIWVCSDERDDIKRGKKAQ